ncbi:hypothetical protein C7N43_26390 [Sphingobacteriales bacterium UPWRP_1]|nr:hypothetical protein B6N25_16245 [Sphingobacteriales bacterium TSM_CSS]PSJ73967.1 hypothetical protein C7N43_26390 [Sphingobacteriales bacterium UPWRP_1]
MKSINLFGFWGIVYSFTHHVFGLKSIFLCAKPQKTKNTKKNSKKVKNGVFLQNFLAIKSVLNGQTAFEN